LEIEKLREKNHDLLDNLEQQKVLTGKFDEILSEARTEIEGSKKSAKKFRHEIANLNNIIELQKNQMTEVQRNLEEKLKKVEEEKAAELAEKDKKIEELGREISELEKFRDESKELKTELEKMKLQMVEMENSMRYLVMTLDNRKKKAEDSVRKLSEIFHETLGEISK
jgi:chromosome segregation ATPase